MPQTRTVNRRILLNPRPRGAPVAIGDVMVGGTVSRVEVSRHSGLQGR